MKQSRRGVLASLGLAGAAAMVPAALRAALAPQAQSGAGSQLFRLAVINDEITQDFEQGCRIASHDFGLSWIELRSMWGKSATALDDKQVEEARKILTNYKLRVTDLASPLFKADWPGAPLSKLSEHRDQFHADFDAGEQDRLLDHCIALSKSFGTDRIRCFDYWRLDDVKPYRAAINAKLQQAAERCRKAGITLMLENEQACNTATGPEAAATLAAVPGLMLNWDAANSAFAGSKPYPDGYNLLPKNRIAHCHAKDVVFGADGKPEWAPVGGGVVDWVGQLEALKRDGYHYGLSLETHWKSGKGPEDSSRASMAGLKKVLGTAGIAAPPTAA